MAHSVAVETAEIRCKRVNTETHVKQQQVHQGGNVVVAAECTYHPRFEAPATNQPSTACAGSKLLINAAAAFIDWKAPFAIGNLGSHSGLCVGSLRYSFHAC